MPFKPEFKFRTDRPLVRMFFSGLMIVKPDASGSECEIFVHRAALDHNLSIEIRLKQPNKPDQIVMRRLGRLELVTLPPNPKKYGFIVTTNQPQGVFGYRGTEQGVEGKSMEYAIDLNTYHPGKTGIEPAAAQPSIFVNDALFYCADITVPGFEVDLQTQAGAFVKKLTPYSALLGANIYATAVNVAWRQNGEIQALPLTNDIPAGAHYEIYVINDPEYVPMPAPGTQPHDELQEYYKILPNVLQTERYKMFYRAIPGQNPGTPVAPQDKGSNRIPCMTVTDTGP